MTSGRNHPADYRLKAALVWGCLVLAGLGTVAFAEDQAAPADSVATAAADSVGATTPPMGAAALAAAAAAGGATNAAVTPVGPFLQDFSSKPKAGVKADVRLNSYFGEDATTLKFRQGNFNNTTKWSWDDYRLQEKTTQKRSSQFSYGAGQMLPFLLNVNGNWDWSDDRTTNTVGFTNQSKRETRMGTLSASRTKFHAGGLVNSLKADAQINDQKSVNQNQRNDFNELAVSGGYQGGLEIASGVTLAGRLYGRKSSGDRFLGNSSSPSTATADSTGFGVYYERGLGTGRVAVTRSNFDREYLDFRKNSNGLIDTVGLAEQDKVVSELETKDAVSLEFENNFKLRRTQLKVKLGRDVNEQDYRVSGIGLKKRQQDKMDLTWSFGVGGDSLSVGYRYMWKWDDQRIKGASAFRGKQFNKSRDLDLTWIRTLIGMTKMTFKYHEGLSQDIAENTYNQNDKDRLLTDVSLRLDRNWPQLFRTALIFSYKQAQDLSIRESRSGNNNIKDSYEISPSYLWTIAPWLTWDQSYQVFIQYTDYTFSELESVNRDDNYNKRGNLSTKVTIKPTTRLDVVVQHDYNKRFNATRTAVDAGGRSFYHKDQTQTISKVDLGITFRAAPGVTLEGATYQTEDTKNILSTRPRTDINRSGQVWVGAKVNHKWGATNPLELSAMVKKYNAYGPAVTATSSDYWEADIWMKWEF